VPRASLGHHLVHGLNLRDRLLPIEHRYLMPDRGGQKRRVARGSHQQRSRVIKGGLLTVRQVDLFVGLHFEAPVLFALHHAHNREPRRLFSRCDFLNAGELELAADGIATRPMVPRQSLTDNSHLGRILIVGLGKVPASQERYTHRPKVVRADHAMDGVGKLIARRRWPACNEEAVAVSSLRRQSTPIEHSRR